MASTRGVLQGRAKGRSGKRLNIPAGSQSACSAAQTSHRHGSLGGRLHPFARTAAAVLLLVGYALSRRAKTRRTRSQEKLMKSVTTPVICDRSQLSCRHGVAGECVQALAQLATVHRSQ